MSTGEASPSSGEPDHDEREPPPGQAPSPTRCRDLALGDPFVLRHRGRFYMYGTNDGPPLPDGRVVPVFRSDDLIHWEPLGGRPDPPRSRGASTGRRGPGLERPVLHGRELSATWCAAGMHSGSPSPTGPKGRSSSAAASAARTSGSRSTAPGCSTTTGALYLFRCLDFVAEDDPPHGTGIVVQPMRDPLTPAGPRAPVLRASALAALREGPGHAALRRPAVRGVDHDRGAGSAPPRAAATTAATAAATTPGPTGPARPSPTRRWAHTMTCAAGKGRSSARRPGWSKGPGHFSVVSPDLVDDWIVLHGRSPGEGARRVWLCPASWGEEGVAIGELTDRPQPAPRLPVDRSSFVGARAASAGWLIEKGTWTPGPDGLRHAADGTGGCDLARWPRALPEIGPSKSPSACPGPGPGRGGLLLGGCGRDGSGVVLDPRPGRLVHQVGGRHVGRAIPAEPGRRAPRPRSLSSADGRRLSGRAEVRVDQVVVIDGT